MLVKRPEKSRGSEAQEAGKLTEMWSLCWETAVSHRLESETAQLSPDPEVKEEEQVQTKDLADGWTACPDGQTG